MSKTEKMEYNHETGAYEKRGKRGFIGELALGMSGIWWAITHPLQGGLRSFGAFSAILGLIALLSGVAHLIAGRPGTARLSTNPTDLGAWGADKLVRPVITGGAAVVEQSVRPVNSDEEQPVIVNLNRDRQNQPEQPEQP